MKVLKLIPIMTKYERCPQCGSITIGDGAGGIVVDDTTYTRTCKCGFRITVDENGNEV